MTQLPVPSTGSRRSQSPLARFTALGVVVAFFAGSSAITYLNTRTLRESARWVTHTQEVIGALEDLLSLMKDAETGQRGFIITGDEKYLDPYNSALTTTDARLEDVARLTADNANQQARIPELKFQISEKRRELANIISIQRASGFEPARDRLATDQGKIAMDAIRVQIAAMKQEEHTLLANRLKQSEDSFRAAVRSAVGSGVLGIALAGIIAWLVERATHAREKEEWLKGGQAGLSEKLMGDQKIEELGQNALSFVCEYLNAKVGAIFVADEGGFRRCATYAVPSSTDLPDRFTPGEGLLGQAAKDGHAFHVNDVPEGYLTIGSSLGRDRPRHLLIAPAKADGAVNSVIELGFFEPVDEGSIELMTRCAEIIGVAVRSGQSRSRILELLEETQRQAEELQMQSEELRVSNEELEEQTRALQQSQARLEQQQSELEQNNMQLEEQTQLLESQKDDLSQAKLKLENQARVVEQASRYKSDFLANMSHELRTPLNSSLILAQLLAENRGGNLTDEQIKFARTIQSSGNDLLALINDVLDLAKIEAGRMDLKPQPVVLTNLLDGLRSQFEPVANNRRLALQFRVAPGAPESIETDPQRLEQVLRNLLSNALKFTEHGEVVMDVSAAGSGRIAFTVRDTGIGIDPSQQRIIFEPFCQADGTTNRKYGGTGLGLSISRELARLLGGEIRLTSELGHGSTFTVILPESHTAPAVEVRPEPQSVAPKPTSSVKQTVRTNPYDREKLTASSRSLLVVDDDPRYAEILADLAHAQNFQCLVTGSAEEALALAREHLPSAVLLDVGLPDGSGLFVLERLKHDARTRHIPVHVLSGNDYSEKAMAMGAIGYMLKPVPREKIEEALHALETRLTHRLRRVLVVEDDSVQRAALCQLLASREVEAIGAPDAEDCLSQLRTNTVDCMVLDLSLPDASGFSLLEKINEDDSYPFPPVIIYTGRELTADEEQALRRYSKSIIIKGAKSPERLLDEVALFLHQVVADLPVEQQRMIENAHSREAALEGKRVLLVEDDVRNVFAITSLLEPLGLTLEVARNGREALAALKRVRERKSPAIDLVLMDIMMPEMDGMTAMREIRQQPGWKKLPIIALTAKAMPNDQEQCLAAGANDYLAKPLDVEKLVSLVRVWMPR
jgi:signal transduction histidine kinase/CheY-like chemotaxis protein/CHASE3 domain sensor protein